MMKNRLLARVARAERAHVGDLEDARALDSLTRWLNAGFPHEHDAVQGDNGAQVCRAARALLTAQAVGPLLDRDPRTLDGAEVRGAHRRYVDALRNTPDQWAFVDDDAPQAPSPLPHDKLPPAWATFAGAVDSLTKTITARAVAMSIETPNPTFT